MVPCARHIWSRIGIRHINYRNESTALKLSQMFILVDLLYVQRVDSFCPIIAYQSIIIYFGKVWKRRVKKRRFEKVSSFKAETFKHAECLLLVLKKMLIIHLLGIQCAWPAYKVLADSFFMRGEICFPFIEHHVISFSSYLIF